MTYQAPLQKNEHLVILLDKNDRCSLISFEFDLDDIEIPKGLRQDIISLSEKLVNKILSENVLYTLAGGKDFDDQLGSKYNLLIRKFDKDESGQNYVRALMKHRK